jgi:hypothetical protein
VESVRTRRNGQRVARRRARRFSFTTGLLAKSSAQRDVKVKVNAITAGIRGTDVWAKSDSGGDLICLLEGNITVSHGAAQFQSASRWKL